MKESTVSYELSAPQPQTHYFHVRSHFCGDLGDSFRVALPIWTPGSYLVREYAKHLINLKAWAGDRMLAVERVDKASWQVAVPRGVHEVTMEYDIWAYEMTVRSSYLDADYGIVTPASVFIYHREWKDRPITLKILMPNGWDIATSLPRSVDAESYNAADYDELVDSPIQMGALVRRPFWVDTVSHELVVAGHGAGTLPRPEFIHDLTRIIETSRDLFGSLPYAHFTFMVTLSDDGGGGLEHRNSANIMVTPNRWRANIEDYPRLLSLFAHEYFHLWNVKRIRPAVLGPFSYQSEVYTSLLWAMEGVTDYFAQWLLGQSHVVTPDVVLAYWAKALMHYEGQPGRFVTSVSDSSREAWIRQYRPDANSPNITVSYYLKGALIGLFLDLELRRRTQGRVTLPAVIRELWDRYGDRGFPEGAYEDIVVELGGAEMRAWIDRFVHGTDAFDESVWESVGLKLDRAFKSPAGERPVWVGLIAAEKDGHLIARQVDRGGPAEAAGLSPDDELVAVDGRRVRTVGEWTFALTHVLPDSTVTVHITHRGELRTAVLQTHEARADDYKLTAVEYATADQQQAFRTWMGAPLEGVRVEKQ